jgi:hypothetical protein
MVVVCRRTRVFVLFTVRWAIPGSGKERGIVQLPWHIQVLAKYGEGPHNTGPTLIPLALAAWLAAMRGGYPRVYAAALLIALMPMINWVAALALAIACRVLLLAALGEPEFRAWRVFAAAGWRTCSPASG